eukprot:scaffold34615_cov180-Amphora_coffeaeformis.AAC.18
MEERNARSTMRVMRILQRRLFFGELILLVLLFVSFALGTTPSSSSSSRTRTRRRIHQGWQACRVGTDPSQGCRHQKDSNSTIWNVTTLPTTALAILLEHHQQQDNEDEDDSRNSGWCSMSDLYTSTHLATLPDIATVGRAYYTLVYELDLTAYVPESQPLYCQSLSQSGQSSQRSSSKHHYTILRMAGINYRAHAYVDGIEQTAALGGAAADYDGMFHRRAYDISCGRRFHIVIEPPLHPGTCQNLNTNNNNNKSSSCHGQGGNHALAADGAVPQYMLGWDWAQAMPDRATGFWGAVHVETYTTGIDTKAIALQDVALQTVSLHSHPRPSKHDVGQATTVSAVTLRLLVRLEHLGEHGSTRRQKESGKLVLQADWGETWMFDDVDFSQSDFDSALSVTQPEQVRLWWPHGMRGDGQEDHPYLHTFTLTLYAKNNNTIADVIDETVVNVGIRTVETFLDETLQGQTFRINGEKIYLVGGNWIGTDQAHRYSASMQRYCDELALHRHAGLNLIRVWGGGTAEQDEFYDCADKLGLLVYQEFWMTGDNNGRWAGNFSWPLDHRAYLRNVKDTILRLRRHPSLLFYGGCNECLGPPGLDNPASDINRGIERALAQHDPRRFYIPSSMSGANVADTFEHPEMWYNRSFGLAFADGPYGLLLPGAFFERNPGLKYKNISIGFQPELGSTNTPTYRGLLRFMSTSEAEGFPRREDPSKVGEVWEFHRFQEWTSSLPNGHGKYDHVYAYFHPDQLVTAADWCAAAQLAAHSQYQHLFAGFISHAFEYTTAVIMWKTQSPWPTLRGFLYDWYLETTGALRGVRATLEDSVSITLDAMSWRLRIVNRSILPLPSPSSETNVGVRFEWFTIQGDLVTWGNLYLDPHVIIFPMSAALVGKDALKWPKDCAEVCFLRLKLILQSSHAASSGGWSRPTWHWLSQQSLLGSDFSSLGRMRERQGGHARLHVTQCETTAAGFQVRVRIDVTGKEVLFYPTLVLLQPEDQQQILPVFDQDETDIVLLPGTTHHRTLKSTIALEETSTKGILQIVLESWNGPAVSQTIRCQNVASIS